MSGRLLNISLDDEPTYPVKKDTTVIKENTPSETNIIDERVRGFFAGDNEKTKEKTVETTEHTENNRIMKQEPEEKKEEPSQQSRFVRPTVERNMSAPAQKTEEKAKKPVRSVGRPSITNKGTIHAKAIPKDLLELARRDAGIPSTVSNSNAVAAYIYMKAIDKSNVAISEELKAIIEECNGDNSVQDMNDKIMHLEKEMSTMSKKMDEISLALNYLVLNASGLSYENPQTAAEVNLLEEGITEIRDQIRKQTKILKRQDNNNGRPFR